VQYDWRGYGMSDALPGPDYSMEAFAADALAVLDAAEFETGGDPHHLCRRTLTARFPREPACDRHYALVAREHRTERLRLQMRRVSVTALGAIGVVFGAGRARRG